ncbi:MAG: DUF5719 family protein, partial [Acidimicrobiia bacterium]
LLASVAVLAAASWMVRPGPPADPQPPPSSIVAPELDYAVCPWVISDDRTAAFLALTSVDQGTAALVADLTFQAAGRAVAEHEVRLNSQGALTVPVADLLQQGVTPALVEVADGRAAAGIVLTESPRLAADTCIDTLPDVWLAPGGSTRTGETLELLLVNPFAEDAVVRVMSASELGIDSSDALEALNVPARSSLTVDLSAQLSLRDELAVTVATRQGLVVAAVRQVGESDAAVWSATAGATEWYLAVPAAPVPASAAGPTTTGGGGATSTSAAGTVDAGGTGVRRLALSTDSALPVNVEIDVFGPEGQQDALLVAEIPAGGQTVVPLDQVGATAFGLRVVAEAPVAAVLVIESETWRAAAAAPGLASRWLVPGVGTSGAGTDELWVLNPTAGDTTLQIRNLSTGETSEVAAAAGQVTRVPVPGGPGVEIRASVDVSVMWTTTLEGSLALSGGVPVDG